jgi:hypothetical protein
VLGQELSVHRNQVIRKSSGVIASLAMTIFIWWARSAMKPKRAELVVLLAIGFTLITLVLGYVWIRDLSLRVVAHEHGIAYTRGGKTTSVRYDEIADIRETVINGNPVVFNIRLHSGRELMVPAHITDHAQFVATVGAQLRPNSLPTATARRRS